MLQNPLLQRSLTTAWYGTMLGALVITVNNLFVEVYPVRGPSMSPTLSPDYHETGRKDLLLVSKRSPAKDLQRGQIVTFWNPEKPEKMSIKRIVALEGDTVVPDRRYPLRIVPVPFGHVWVEGDNWRSSLDSNDFGPISKALITGKATAVVWPPSRFGSEAVKEIPGRSRITHGTAVLPAELRD